MIIKTARTYINIFILCISFAVLFVIITPKDTYAVNYPATYVEATEQTENLIEYANQNYPYWSGTGRRYIIITNPDSCYGGTYCQTEHATTLLYSVPEADVADKDWNGVNISNSLQISTRWTEDYFLYNTWNSNFITPLEPIYITISGTGTPVQSTWTLNQESMFGTAGTWKMVYMYNVPNYSTLTTLNDNPIPEPEPEITPLIKYEVINGLINFTIKDTEEYNSETYEKVHWLISYGSIDGEPQLQTWEAWDTDDKTKFSFTMPYQADNDENDIWGTYSFQAVLVDENDEPISNATSILYTWKKGYINKYDGICTDLDCETTPIDDNRISTDIMENCTFSADFPFLNTETCFEGIKAILGSFDIRSTTIGANFDNMIQNNGCHQFYVFDEWLNLPDDTQVCPNIPSEVRTVITPFIIFGLGLIGLNIIMKRSRDD